MNEICSVSNQTLECQFYGNRGECQLRIRARNLTFKYFFEKISRIDFEIKKDWKYIHNCRKQLLTRLIGS